MNQFLSDLDVRYIDGRRWLVTAPFTYHLVQPNGPEFIRVDVGTITDFASIPKLLKLRWPSPGGPWDKPAVIHDELYTLPFVQHRTGTARRIDRKEADAIFFEAMGVTQTPEQKRWALWSGVRLGGWVAWNRYRRLETTRATAGSVAP